MHSASSNRECISSSFLSWPLTNLNLCTLKKKKTERKKGNRNIWRDKCNTTLTKSHEKSLSFICGEMRFIVRRAFSLHFLKGAFWQTLCSGRHTHKTRCHGAIWIWWQAHYHVDDSWQRCRGKWTGLPISCWKDCGGNRVFCSKNSGTNWLH